MRSLYVFLVGLHPPRFRRQFADEMIYGFAESPGIPAKLWLIADGVLSLFRQWLLRPAHWHPVPPAKVVPFEGAIRLPMINAARPNSAALIGGTLLSVTFFAALAGWAMRPVPTMGI